MKEHRWQVRNGGDRTSSTTYECSGCGWWKFVTAGLDGEETMFERPEGLEGADDGEIPKDCDEAIVKSVLET